MQVQSYLMFNGRTEEALEFYKKAIGAKVEMVMRFKDDQWDKVLDEVRSAVVLDRHPQRSHEWGRGRLLEIRERQRRRRLGLARGEEGIEQLGVEAGLVEGAREL